jgi:hypothetical protein
VGFALGTCEALAIHWVWEHRPLDFWGNLPLVITVYVCALLLALAPIVALLRVTQRWSVTLGFAATFAVSLGITENLAGVLARPDGGADVGAWLDADEAIALVGLVLIYVAAAAILRVACRTLLVRTVEQGPDDCAWCGYTRGSNAITRCPECGHEATTTRYRMHRYIGFVTGLARRWKIPVAIVCLALVALSIPPIRERTLPAMAFYGRFAGAARERSWSRDLTVWLPESPGGGRGLAVRFLPSHGQRPDMMSVEVAAWDRPGPDAALSNGSGRVVARLNPEQIHRVLAHGLPEALVGAMYARANDIAWTAQSTARGEYPVDPTPFFPK